MVRAQPANNPKASKKEIRENPEFQPQGDKKGNSGKSGIPAPKP